MALDSPADALGTHATAVRDLLVEVVRNRHDLAADAHHAAATRYSLGFGTQWRDLLDDAREALTQRGFPVHKLPPGGYKIPVVNDCLVYVWRIPETPDALSKFASSPTRKNGFAAPPPPPMLFDPGFMDGEELAVEGAGAADDSGLGRALMAASATMPVVLVMVQSTPRQLQSIQWGVAVLDEDGKVEVRGQESIWEPEVVTDTDATEVESFDSGTPVLPAVGLQEQEGPQADA